MFGGLNKIIQRNLRLVTVKICHVISCCMLRQYLTELARWASSNFMHTEHVHPSIAFSRQYLWNEREQLLQIVRMFTLMWHFQQNLSWLSFEMEQKLLMIIMNYGNRISYPINYCHWISRIVEIKTANWLTFFLLTIYNKCHV